MIKLKIFSKSLSGKICQRTLTYINPQAADKVLRTFVEKLYNLTTNTLGNIYKLGGEELGEKIGDNFVTKLEILQILRGLYEQVFDPDPITREEIKIILNS